MKIVHINTRSDLIGGAQVHLRDLSLGLQSLGHDVLVTVGGTGPFTDDLQNKGIACRPLKQLVRPLNPWKDCLAVFEIRSILKQLKPDLVTTHSSKAGWVGRLAARSLNIPVTFTAHGWTFTEGMESRLTWFYRWAEKLAAPLADRVITVSEYDRELALNSGVGRADQVVVVHNGMPDIPKSLRGNPGKSPPRLLMVARFEKQKDHYTLVKGLNRLQHLPWELDLIGDGPLRPQVEALARELGISSRIRFHGVCGDVAEKLAAAQVFILLSLWEGFPLTILEAMRAGLPVVATDVGGVKEAVADGSNGFLIPRGDVEKFCERLTELLEKPELRVRMGLSARDEFAKRFTFDKMLAKTMAVYRDAVSTKVKKTGTFLRSIERT
jgi:glycosyltransferase involved in cell wall biosynthesis